MSPPRDVSRSARRYLHDIRAFPILSREEERRLAERMRRGELGAMGRLVESNLPFVVRVASDYSRLGVPFEDLLNEGNLGLIEAARRFDPSRGTRFITYACWWVRKAMLASVARHLTLVHLPLYQLRRRRHLRDAERALAQSLGRAPGSAEVGESLGEGPEPGGGRPRRVCEMSLDAPAGEDAESLVGDFLPDAGAESAEEALLRGEAGQLLRRALRCLGARERAVLVLRYGLGDGRTRTLRQVGSALGLSGERVRQIEREALRRIRRHLAASGRRRAAPSAARRRGRRPSPGPCGRA